MSKWFRKSRCVWTDRLAPFLAVPPVPWTRVVAHSTPCCQLKLRLIGFPKSRRLPHRSDFPTWSINIFNNMRLFWRTPRTLYRDRKQTEKRTRASYMRIPRGLAELKSVVSMKCLCTKKIRIDLKETKSVSGPATAHLIDAFSCWWDRRCTYVRVKRIFRVVWNSIKNTRQYYSQRSFTIIVIIIRGYTFLVFIRCAGFCMSFVCVCTRRICGE